MSADYFNLASGQFFQDWSNTGLITANDDWSLVPSIVGFRGDGLTSGTGTDPQTITANGTNVVDVNANQTNTTTFNTGGVTEFELTNPTIALAGSGTANAPFLAIYLNAAGRENVTLSFNARDLETTDSAIQQIAVQYRLSDAGSWTNLPAGYIADATAAGGATLVTPVSVTLPADAAGVATLQVRIMTTNAVGNDEWVGIDDIRVISTPLDMDTPGVLGVADASVTEGDTGTRNLDFIVTRSGGSSGAATVDYTVDLTGTATADDFAAGTQFTGTVSFAAGETSRAISLAVRGDTVGEGNETLAVTLGATTGDVTVDDGSAQGVITNDDIATIAIHDIQGAGHRSALVGQSVVTGGIVTAVDSNGFYFQDAMGDGDVATSDGLFVFTSTAPTVAVGDEVTVSGTVSEFQGGTGGLTITQIVSPTITIDSRGNALPDTVLIGVGGRLPPTEAIEDDGFTSFDPATDGLDFYESLEGMRVTIDRPSVVSNTDTRFGETDVVASRGEGATGFNDRGGITISPGDYNPEKIQIDSDSGIFAGYDPMHSIGDELANVTGVVNYGFGFYEVLVTEAVTVTNDATLPRERTALRGDANNVTIATMNVENLDPNDPAALFDLLAEQIVFNLRAPDILALQEVQDADGAGTGSNLSGAVSAQELIDAIVAEGGPTYLYVEIAPTTTNTTGGEPNGNIRNGYLYNPDRVDYIEGSAELIDGAAYTNTRKPLVAQFGFNGETITTVNVHFTSRGGSEPLQGANQPPTNAGEAARFNQAAGIKAYVNDLLAGDPDANVAILGDLNGFYFEDAQLQLTDPARGGVFTNAATLLAEEERYSYVFQGNSQLLDAILVTGDLFDRLAYDSVHINGEYNRGDRTSDHDPQVARFRFTQAPTELVLDNDSVAENRAAGAVVGTLSATDTPGDTATFALVDDAGGRFVVDAETGEITTTASFDHEAVDSYTITASVTDSADLTTQQQFVVTVDDVPEAPIDLSFVGGRFDENVAVGTRVARVSAVDPEGGAVRYSLTDNAGGRFSIDADSGLVTTLGTFDFETERTIPLVARVTDDTGRFTEETLTFFTRNVNEAPVAVGDSVAVREDATTFNLARLLVRNDEDVDAGPLPTIQSVNTVGTFGTIVFDRATQTLTYAADADIFDTLAPGTRREDTFSYTAVDAGGLTSTATVTVTVFAVNDARRFRGTNEADTLVGDAGENHIIGLRGADSLSGEGGHDLIQGGDGDDVILGGGDRDALYGDAGADRIDGGDRNDVIFGGAGNDQLSGGAGQDRFHIVRGDGVDTILDFETVRDLLVLDGVEVDRSTVSDANGDGLDDLTIVFTGGSAVILLGVDTFSDVQFGEADYFSTARPGVDFTTGLGDAFMG